jgi:hypothetical protein
MNNYNLNNKLINIHGLHEIHISIDPSQIFEFKIFCNKRKYKCIFPVAFNGVNKNQLMLSKWKTGTSLSSIQKANEIEAELKDNNIRVHRVKVEAMMHNKGVPEDENNLCLPYNYFEYHLKMIINNIDMIKNISYIMELFKNEHPDIKCAISFNCFRENIKLLITLRLKGEWGSNKCEKYKDIFIDFIESKGIHFEGEIQKEFEVYDNNVSYDNGWL